MMIPYFTITYMEVGCGIIRGLGKSITSTIISLIGACLFRIVWILTVFKAYPNLKVLYISYPITWIITGTIFLIVNIVTIKKMIKLRDLEIKKEVVNS